MTQHPTQAFVLTKFGESKQAFQLQEITLNIGENQLLVEVIAFGLNYADVMARNGKYRETPPLPTTIGYEVVGEVIAVGANCSSDLVGKRIVAFSQFGGYARHAVIEKEAFAVLREEVTDEEALALCTQYVTAYYMSNYQSRIRKNDIVLIHAAAGGVGSGLIQLCKNQGATVIAKVGDDAKLDVVKKLGADYAINYNKTDYELEIQRLLKGQKLSFSFNPVGGTTFKKDMRLLGANGKLVLFGGSELSNGKYGIVSQLNFLRKMGMLIPAFLMMQSKSVLGVNMLKIAIQEPLILKECMEEVQRLFAENKWQIVIGKVYRYTELTEAHLHLESGKSVGKLVVRW